MSEGLRRTAGDSTDAVMQMRSDEHSTLATTDDPAVTTRTSSYETAELIADIRFIFAVQTRTFLLTLYAGVLFIVQINFLLAVLVD